MGEQRKMVCILGLIENKLVELTKEIYITIPFSYEEVKFCVTRLFNKKYTKYQIKKLIKLAAKTVEASLADSLNLGLTFVLDFFKSF